MRFQRTPIALSVLAIGAFFDAALAAGPPAVGPNVNMVANTTLGDGDPFLSKQNEPSLAVSSLNPQHLLGGSNDYRLVDFATVLGDETADAWVSIFKSVNGGATWTSTVLPGCSLNILQCNDPHGASIKGLQFASDPTVRPGPYGAFFYSFIAGNRGTSASSIIAVARLFDRNDNVQIGQDPFQIDVFNTIDTGTPGQDKDKPWAQADIPGRPWNGSNKCTIPTYPAGTQSQPAFNVYVAYSNFTGQDTSNPHPSIYVATSTDCGQSYGKPVKVSQSVATNQGAILALDPVTGAVYIAWRQFFTAANGSPNAIYIVKSTDGGQTFSKPTLVAQINAFDQGTSSTSFRTNDYPALAVSVDAAGKSRVHVAWTQRGVGPNGDARIVMATSPDGLTWSGNYVALDNWIPNITYNPANPNGRGHQLMPTLSFAGGKLTAAWYDQREDQTVGVMVCPTGAGTCKSISQFVEQRQAAPGGNLAASPPQFDTVFTPFITDGTTGLLRRHTLDVFVAMADPADVPAFASSRASKYFFGSVSTPGSISEKPIKQLRFNVPNVPIFSKYTVPFMGDYIDIAPTMFLPTGNSSRPYKFNTSASNKALFHATWADNRDIIPPRDGNWSNNTPIQKLVTNPDGTVSVVTNTGCLPGQEGSNNQNVYTAAFGEGVGAFATENSKLLNSSTPRGFVVVVQNITTTDQTYQITIANQPAGGSASFLQDPTSLLTQITVTVPARSTVSRLVWIKSTSPGATVTVNISDSSGANLLTSVVLNGDPASNLVTNTSLGTNDDLTNDDLTNDDLTNTLLTNDDLTNDDLTNDDLTNAVITNDDLTNLGVPNDDLTNHEISNDDLTNNTILNDDLTNGAIADSNFVVTNRGNTDVTLNVKMLLRNQQVPPGYKLQLILHKVYATPMPKACTYAQQGQNVQVANVAVPNVALFNDLNLLIADVTNGSASNPSIPLLAGETGKITLRVVAGAGGTQADAGAFGSTGAKFIAIGPSSNATPIPLIISTLSLLNGTYGTPYVVTPQPLQSLGGKGALTWTVTGLPAGLSYSTSTGVITGTPTAVGTFPISATVVDSSSPQQTDSQTLTLVINPAPQTITFGPLANHIFGDAPFALTATASSGLPVSYSTSAPCTVSGSTLTITGAGTCNVTASQAGNAYYQAAAPVTQSFTIAQAGQSITFGALANHTYGDQPFMLAATASSGLPVSYAASGPCTVSGSTLTITGGGTCTVTASQPGNTNYLAATPVVQSFSIAAAVLTITANPAQRLYGAANPAFTATYAGFVNGDGPGSLTGALSCTTTATSISPTGPYPITCAGQTSNNYAISYAPGTLTVNSAPLIGKVQSVSRPYGTANPTFTVLYTGFVNGETSSIVTGTLTCSTTPATTSTSPAGTYPINCSGQTAPNYAITYVPGSLTITQTTPAFSGLSSPTITEGTASVTLSGTISGNGLFPTGSVSIKLNNVTQAAAISVANGSFSSTFATANLAGGSYAIAYTYAGDTNFATTSSGGTLAVTNLPPSLSVAGGSVTVAEGSLAAMTGSYSDIENVALNASVGTITKTGTNSGAWSWSFLTADGPSQTQTVTISADDGNGGKSTATFMLNVLNVPPTATFQAPSIAAIGGSFTLSLTNPVDPSPVDTAAGFTYAFDCGDGLGLSTLGAANSRTCPTPTMSVRMVAARICDKDGGCTSYSGSVSVFGFTLLSSSMTVERSFHTATLLNNGKVLLSGGFNSKGQPLGSAELYDPTTRTFAVTGTMPNKAAAHTATLLQNGKVLIAGGGNSNAQIYDPASGQFSSTGGAGSNISYHSATLLPNGKVLIAGGTDNSGKTTAAALLYDPVAGNFTGTGSMASPRERHTATLLPNGKVLIAGGRSKTTQVLATAEIYDPGTGTFSPAASMAVARFSHTAASLVNGQVLITGGSGTSGDVAAAEIYDPVSGAFAPAGSLSGARDLHTATVLGNGQVLEAGGNNSGSPVQSSELFNGSAFGNGGNMAVARAAHTATLLADGTVLVTGGVGSAGVSLASAERYATQ